MSKRFYVLVLSFVFALLSLGAPLWAQEATPQTDAAVQAAPAPAAEQAPAAAVPTGSRLEQAIAQAPQGTERGQIDPAKPAGFWVFPELRRSAPSWL